jgi:hypothetical protein
MTCTFTLLGEPVAKVSATTTQALNAVPIPAFVVPMIAGQQLLVTLDVTQVDEDQQHGWAADLALVILG